MKLNSSWRRWFGARGSRQAIGCGLFEGEVALVRLDRMQDRRLRVMDLVLLDGPSTAMQETLQAQRPLDRRCAMALPESVCASGQLPWTVQTSEELLDADILLEAAQALQLPPNAIAYDFAIDRGAACCHWAAAPLDTLAQWRRVLRAAGLRLQAVEPQEQAARRALALIEGEGAALWRQAPQDWRFRMREDGPGDPPARLDMLSLRADPRVMDVWPQLVACGLALRCWQEDI